MPQRHLAAVFLALPLLGLSGCKIELSTTTGGSIQTLSGRFSCEPGSNCAAVDVSDLFFDETFVGEPESGFRFVGWRRRDRGLCGGRTDNCRLFTSGFAGNEILLSFLERDDEVFFLEAVFAESGGASGEGSGSGNASSCWNPDLVAPGTTIVASYSSTDGQGGNLDFSYDQFIEDGATFNGQSARRGTSNVTSTGDEPSTSVTRTFFQIPVDQQIRNLGAETEVLSPASATITLTTTPFDLQRFDLSAGQSFSQSFDAEVTTSAGGQSVTITTSFDETITFDGIESVTVPAGTFDACRFTSAVTAVTNIPGGNSTSTSREWFQVGTGMLLKSEDEESSAELESASINGVDI